MRHFGRETGLDRRILVFVPLSVVISAVLLLGMHLVVPVLEGMPTEDRFVFGTAVVAVALVVLAQFMPSILPFWLAGWLIGWQVMLRAGLADRYCALSAAVMAVLAASVLGWVARYAGREPAHEVLMLPYLLAGGAAAALTIYRQMPERHRAGRKNGE